MRYDVFTWLQWAKKLYGAILFPLLERYGLTQTEADVLLFLVNNPAHDTARDMAEHRHLAKSHVSVSVEALVQRGLIERFYQNGNRKTIHLRVTERARPIIEEGLRLQNRFGAAMVAGFSEQEILQLDALLSRIRRNIENALAAWRSETWADGETPQTTEALVARLRSGDPPKEAFPID